jgi:glycosyltransferase involved in cell wall biosynthesis
MKESKKNTVSIAYSSPLTGIGGKAPFLECLIEGLEKKEAFEIGYGLYTRGGFIQKNKPLPFLGKYRTPNGSKIYLSTWAYIIPKLLEKLHFVPFGRPWITKVIDIIYAKKIAKDPSTVVYIGAGLNRTARLCHNHGKRVVIEHAGIWQEKTLDLLKSEYEQFLPEHRTFDEEFKKIDARKPLLMEPWNEIVNLSKSGKKSFTDYGFPEEKFTIVNGGMEKGFQARARFFDEGKEIVFICTAYHDFRKGTHRLIRAWSRYRLPYKLMIIGTFKGKEIPLFLEKEKLNLENVVFMGNKSRKEISEIYQSHNAVGVLNTFADDYPRGVLEYLAEGMPVLVSPPGDCDIVEYGKHGIIISNPADEEEIKNGVEKLADPSFYKNCVENVNKLKLRSVEDYQKDLVNFLL